MPDIGSYALLTGYEDGEEKFNGRRIGLPALRRAYRAQRSEHASAPGSLEAPSRLRASAPEQKNARRRRAPPGPTQLILHLVDRS